MLRKANIYRNYSHLVTHCLISFPNSLIHLLHIQLKFTIDRQSEIDFILPSWRSGRYALATFVASIQSFEPKDSNGLKISISENCIATCSLTKNGHVNYSAKNYQELTDSPLLASPDLRILNHNTLRSLWE